MPPIFAEANITGIPQVTTVQLVTVQTHCTPKQKKYLWPGPEVDAAQ